MEIKEDELKCVVTSMASHGAVKCPRCYKWHYVKENYDNLCDDCCHVLIDDYPDLEMVVEIKKAYAVQRLKYHKPS